MQVQQSSSPRWRFTTACLVVYLSSAPAVYGGFTVLGTSGWQARWDSTLDPYVNITLLSETANSVVMTRSAIFTQAPSAGGFPTIPIVFEQIAFPAVTQLIITDEQITNATGSDWTEFRMSLLGGLGMAFDVAESASYHTSPFENKTFAADNRSIQVDGFGQGTGSGDGRIQSGETWTPGFLSGALFIDVVLRPQAPFSKVALKETPSPEPSTLILLSLCGGVALARRRGRPVVLSILKIFFSARVYRSAAYLFRVQANSSFGENA